MQFRNIVVGAIAVASLAGCSFERKQVDYKAGAVQVRPLEVPPDLTTPETEQRYTIPGTDGEKAANYSEYSKKKVEPCANPAPVAAPAPTEAAAPGKIVRLEDGKGGKRILLDEPFDRSWRRIGLALEQARIAVSDKDRSKGVYFVPVTIKDKKKPVEYQVKLRETKQGSEAQIVNAAGKSDEEAVRLTELLFSNLEEKAAPVLPPSDGNFLGDTLLPSR
jgi:outer membrane protein assembly factor BamC